MYAYLENLPISEKRNILIDMILKNVGIGDEKRSTMHIEKLISIFLELPAEEHFVEIKLLAVELNALLRQLTHTYKVHAHYSEDIYRDFCQNINTCTLFSQLEKLLKRMVIDYLQLIRNYSRQHYSNLIRSCLDYIDFHFAEPITLSGLAEHFSVSDSYLSSRFMQETGQNFVTYVNTVRINYSCTLLRRLQISMQKVAELCGFSSSNYFARVFHQQMGISPTEFRKHKKILTELPTWRISKKNYETIKEIRTHHIRQLSWLYHTGNCE